MVSPNTHPSFEGVSIKGEKDELKKIRIELTLLSLPDSVNPFLSN